MFLPVQIPTAIEHESTQSGQCVAGLFAPMHPLMLLSSGHNQVVAFFDVSAADVVALRPAFSVIGDIRLAVLQIVDQLVELFEVFGLWAVLFQDSDGLWYLPTPQVFEQPAEQLSLGLAATTDQAGQVIAFLAAVIPIQQQRSQWPGCQAFLEEAADPTCAIAQQGDLGLQATTEAKQQEQLLQHQFNTAAQVAVAAGGAHK